MIEVVASLDGDWIAIGDSDIVRFYRRDVLVATMKGHRVRGFVGSSRVLAEGADGAVVVDPASGKVVSQLPTKPFAAGASTLALVGDGEHVWWITRRGLARWNSGASSFTIVTAGREWASAEVALRAPVAIVRREDGLYRLDLASGSFDRFSSRGAIYAVSPDGARCAIVGVNKVEIVDTTTGQPVATVGGSDKIRRVAFSENDSMFAFDENGVIRIADIAASKVSVRQGSEASRFRGWNTDSSASIQHEGATRRLDVTTQTIAQAPGTLAVATTSPLSLAVLDHTIVATSNGKRLAKLDLGEPPRPGPGLAQTYWQAEGSPNGALAVVWIRRPDVGPIPEPDESNAKDRSPKCDRDDRGECILEYVAQLWRISSPPALIWETRPDGKRPQLVRPWPYPKIPSGPTEFSQDGKFVLFGFDDGDVIVRSTDSAGSERIEALHRAPITRIEVAPNSAWVFTEDAEGEQRIWPL
ncbi:MAG: WD40 repeat domain-containing protein [Kofleriaceae bacterium]